MENRMEIEIREVKTKKELRKFVKYNLELYKNNPYHVPNLIDEEMMTLSKDKNPAFESCEAIYFLAYKNGKIVGRIAGIIVPKSNLIWKQKNARFGFVDFIDDDQVVDALFGAVVRWAKEKGMDTLHGPLGFTDMDHEGMLVEGFDQPGTMATIYNYPYYPKQLERIGFVKDQDWIERKIDIPACVPEKHLRIGEIVKQKYGLKVLKFKKRKEIWPYAYKIFDTLNACYASLYGFTPLTPKQIQYYIKMYIPMLQLKLISVILREADDAVVGFGISMPNMTRAMQKAKGRFLPFGFIYLLKALYSKPKVVDLYLTGVLPEYQNKGVNALLFNDLIPEYNRIGAKYAESNPELVTNTAVQAQWQYFKTEHHKTRRAYTKQI
jgi:GNAT superfamily N-acetyltransferase